MTRGERLRVEVHECAEYDILRGTVCNTGGRYISTASASAYIHTCMPMYIHGWHGFEIALPHILRLS